MHGTFRADPKALATPAVPLDSLEGGRAIRLQGRLDLAEVFGGYNEYDEAYLSASVTARQACRVWMAASADWWMQWWLNGRLVIDTTRTGNGSHPLGPLDWLIDLDLQAGENKLCARIIGGGKSFSMRLTDPFTVWKHIAQYRKNAEPASAESAADGLRVIQHRLYEKFVRADGGEGLARQAAGLAEALNAEGRWPDVEYDNSAAAAWGPMDHVVKLATLSRAIAKASDPPAEWLDTARRALDAWTREGFFAPNWWHNRIGVPGTMATILLALQPHLDAERWTAGLDVLRQVEVEHGRMRKDGGTCIGWMTGANTLWIAERAIVLACLTDRPELVEVAQLRAAEQCRFSDHAGIQTDGSYHLHGPQMQAGGYGTVHAASAASLAWILSGTPWGFSDDALEPVSRFVLDGLQWFVVADRMNPAVQGRAIARKSGTGLDRRLLEMARRLAPADPANREELEALIARLEHGNGPALSGNRMYGRSDMMVHRRTGWVASVSGVSKRTEATESINDENILGAHINEGMTLLWRRGDEYDGIFPVWDWEKLPGVTCIQNGDMPAPDEFRQPGKTAFVGGVSDGDAGLFAFDFTSLHDDPPLTARKAWFFFDDLCVWLGAGIHADTVHPVFTTLAQRRQHGDMQTSPDGAANAWCWHDRIGYIPLDESPRVNQCRAQTGSWHRINRQYAEETLSIPVFSRWIDHGANPVAVGYAELIATDVDSAHMPDLAAYPPVRVLANTPALQAAEHPDDDLLMAVFYEAGELSVQRGRVLSVEQPCTVLIRDLNGDALITASDPAQTHDTIRLTFDGVTHSLRAATPCRRQRG